MQNDKQKFKEDFIRRLIKFSTNIITFCEELKTQRSFWPIIDQIIRSSTSVGANVMEAKSSSSRRDYLRFFEIALKSANETKYWLLIIQESNPSLKEKISMMFQECDELSKIIAASVLTLKGKR